MHTAATFPWDANTTLQFEDTSYLVAYPREPHVRYRGKYQMVLTSENHPIVTMFPQYCNQVTGQAKDAIGIPLHMLIAALANVCGRPLGGPIHLTIGRDALEPDAMDRVCALQLNNAACRWSDTR